MQRRTWLRLIGGGVIGSAVGTGLAGCSTELPPEAVAAWAGPGSAEGVDPRHWALAHALLAPSSHNRQPWLVDLREPNAITLHVDRERLLPETDPWFRQIVVSQGTFLELLVMALAERGLAARVQPFPQGEFGPRTLDDRPVARVHWQPGAAPPPRDPLFTQVLRRRTAKVAYDTARPVDAALAQALVDQVPAGTGLRSGHVLAPDRVAALRTLCIESARIEVGTPRTALESARLTRVGPDEIRRHRDGISLNALMPRAALALGLFDRTQAPAPGSATFDQVMKRFVEHSQSAMGFVWLASDGGGRGAEVQAGRAFVRQQLTATALGLQMHPMSQALQEFDEMSPWLDQAHQLLLGQPAGRGAVVQMLCRIGHAAPVSPSPRRPLDSLLRT